MRRRDFIAGLGGAVALPVAARAQQAGRTYRIGIVSPQPSSQPHYVALVEGLGRLGFREGEDLQIDWQGSVSYTHLTLPTNREV